MNQNNVATFPNAAEMVLGPEHSARLDALEAEGVAANETFRLAYTAHTTALQDLEARKRTLWDELAVQFNLDTTKAYQVDTVDGKRVLSLMPQPAAAPETVQ